MESGVNRPNTTHYIPKAYVKAIKVSHITEPKTIKVSHVTKLKTYMEATQTKKNIINI